MSKILKLSPFLACGCLAFALDCAGADRELVLDAHFQQGFNLLEPRPGQRVVYGRLPGAQTGPTVWDLAQWSSRFPVRPDDCRTLPSGLVCSNNAKVVRVGRPGSSGADLSLAANAGVEYLRPRKSAGEPWVHLLVQQDFKEPPRLGSLAACNFHLEARLNHSRLADTNAYSAAIHAAQFFVYIPVANRNPQAPGYQECFWFGVPVYDNRERLVSAYEAQDFGGTKLFIFTPGSSNFTRQSTHDSAWVTLEKDLLPLMRQGLDHARKKGFIRGSKELQDYAPLGVFIGWELPGSFDVDLQIRNLSLKAVSG